MRLLKVLFLLLFNLVSAQSISSDWTPISSDEVSIIYLNSSKIIGYGNEISVWAIEKLEESSISDKGERYSKIKTHYLFNQMKKRYAEVGVIYYDNKEQIINRSSKSNFQGTSDAFMTPIKSNPKVETIYKEVISFLITGNIKPIESDDTSKNSSVAKEDENINMEIPVAHRQLAEKHIKREPSLVIENESIVKTTNQNATVGVATSKISEKNDTAVDLTKESWNNIPKIVKRMEIEEKPTITTIESSKEFQNFKVDDSINIQLPLQTKYNFTNERALKNAIFTDGNLYCFQVSSWKTKAYADRELNKLTSDGYQAFLVSVKPRHKRSIWHRVRVGYFNSFEETKEAQKSVGKN